MKIKRAVLGPGGVTLPISSMMMLPGMTGYYPRQAGQTRNQPRAARPCSIGRRVGTTRVERAISTLRIRIPVFSRESGAGRYELAAAASGSKLYFGGGNGGERNLNPLAGARVDIFDVQTREWQHVRECTPGTPNLQSTYCVCVGVLTAAAAAVAAAASAAAAAAAAAAE